jgi:hypothetical protein
MNRKTILDNKCVNHGYQVQHNRSGRMCVDFINDGVYKPYNTNPYHRPIDMNHSHKIVQMGGNNNTYDPIDNHMTGGGKSSVFRSGYSMHMIADATEPKLINAFRSRLDHLGISRMDQSKIKPHITLMQFQINKANPDHQILVGSGGKIRSDFKRHLEYHYNALSPQMYLLSRKGKYEIMGESMTKVYKSVNPTYITNFRMSLYRYLENKLGRPTRKIGLLNGKRYYVYGYRGRDLVAVPEHYHGKGVWKPHLSLIKLGKLQKANPYLYDAYRRSDIRTLVNALGGVKGTMDQINLGYHFGSLRTSVI